MFLNFKFNILNSQKGISLVITFLIMSTMLGIVIGVSSLLFKEIKLLGSIGNAIPAFYAAESGLEKTLYLIKRQPRCANCADSYTDSVGQATYTVSVTIRNGTASIQSQGFYRGTSRTVNMYE